MNTLTFDITSTSTRTPEEQLRIAQGKQAKAAWRTWLAKGHLPSAAQLAIYAFLRGASIEKAFAPITNPNKLANGQYRWQGRDNALQLAMQRRHQEWAPFASMLEGAQSEDLRWPVGAKAYVAGSHPLLDLFAQEAGAIRARKDA